MAGGLRLVIHCVLLVLLLGVSGVGGAGRPVQAQGEPGFTAVDGWRFQVLALESALVYVGDGVAPEVRARFLWAAERASVQVPVLFGTAPTRTELYLLPSRGAFRQALDQFAAVPADAVSGGLSAYQYASGRHPGLYVDTSAYTVDADALWIVAHELTHQVMGESFAPQTSFPQWFNEGVAEYSAARVVQAEDPAYFARRDVRTRARVAQSARQDRIPAFSSLGSNTAWLAALDSGAPVYESARLATELAIQRADSGSLARTLTLVAGGVAFPAAYEQAFGHPPAELDEAFSSWIRGALLPQFPSGVMADRTSTPASDTMLLMFVNGVPEETLTWSFTGPRGCQGQGTTMVDRFGLADFSFYLLETARSQCAGDWDVQVTGDRGSTGRLQFRFTAA